MKNTCLLILVLFSFSYLYSQQTDLQKKETKGELTEITLYYENGTIMQHGFYTKEGELHSSWESYNSDGSRKCLATYNYGEKVGVWTYWKANKITKITYVSNKVINIEEINTEKNVKKEF